MQKWLAAMIVGLVVVALSLIVYSTAPEEVPVFFAVHQYIDKGVVMRHNPPYHYVHAHEDAYWIAIGEPKRIGNGVSFVEYPSIRKMSISGQITFVRIETTADNEPDGSGISFSESPPGYLWRRWLAQHPRNKD